MRHDDFNKIVKEQLQECEALLSVKCAEYASAPLERIDRLAHFKKAAALRGTSSKDALFGMLAKHIVSLADMCADRNRYPHEMWIEKITDTINYLLILRAMVEEDAESEALDNEKN